MYFQHLWLAISPVSGQNSQTLWPPLSSILAVEFKLNLGSTKRFIQPAFKRLFSHNRSTIIYLNIRKQQRRNNPLHERFSYLKLNSKVFVYYSILNRNRRHETTFINLLLILSDKYDICLLHELGSAHVKFDIWIKRRTLSFGLTQTGITYKFGTWKVWRLNWA